jgi:hypothetical protein
MTPKLQGSGLEAPRHHQHRERSLACVEHVIGKIMYQLDAEAFPRNA